MKDQNHKKDIPLSRHSHLDHFKYEVAQEMGLANRVKNKKEADEARKGSYQ